MKRLIVLFVLLVAGTALQAQTVGEKESFETMKSAANLYLLNGDFAAAKAQYEGIFKLYRQYESFTKEVRPDYEKCLRELDKLAAAKKMLQTNPSGVDRTADMIEKLTSIKEELLKIKAALDNIV